jgi:hypothetical protein
VGGFKVGLTGLLDLFLYTPIPWVLLFYGWLYRHDLGRVLHPLVEHSSLRDWWDVCNNLGLISPGEVRQPKRSGVRRIVLLLVVSLVLSGFWIVVPLKAFYTPLLCQIIAGGYLLGVARYTYLGAVPAHPFRDQLDIARTPSRMLHAPSVRGVHYGPMKTEGEKP